MTSGILAAHYDFADTRKCGIAYSYPVSASRERTYSYRCEDVRQSYHVSPARSMVIGIVLQGVSSPISTVRAGGPAFSFEQAAFRRDPDFVAAGHPGANSFAGPRRYGTGLLPSLPCHMPPCATMRQRGPYCAADWISSALAWIRLGPCR